MNIAHTTLLGLSIASAKITAHQKLTLIFIWTHKHKSITDCVQVVKDDEEKEKTIHAIRDYAMVDMISAGSFWTYTPWTGEHSFYRWVVSSTKWLSDSSDWSCAMTTQITFAHLKVVLPSYWCVWYVSPLLIFIEIEHTCTLHYTHCRCSRLIGQDRTVASYLYSICDWAKTLMLESSFSIGLW